MHKDTETPPREYEWGVAALLVDAGVADASVDESRLCLGDLRGPVKLEMDAEGGGIGVQPFTAYAGCDI